MHRVLPLPHCSALVAPLRACDGAGLQPTPEAHGGAVSLGSPMPCPRGHRRCREPGPSSAAQPRCSASGVHRCSVSRAPHLSRSPRDSAGVGVLHHLLPPEPPGCSPAQALGDGGLARAGLLPAARPDWGLRTTARRLLGEKGGASTERLPSRPSHKAPGGLGSGSWLHLPQKRVSSKPPPGATWGCGHVVLVTCRNGVS